jgi:hypothetical protein
MTDDDADDSHGGNKTIPPADNDEYCRLSRNHH